MKKSLFLLFITLVGICPEVYGGHYGGAFEPNITLPLKGEEILGSEMLCQEYSDHLYRAYSTFFLTNIALCRYEQKMRQQLTSKLRRCFNSELISKIGCEVCIVGAVLLPALILLGLAVASERAIRQYNEYHLGPLIRAHNAAMENNREGIIYFDADGNRVLRMDNGWLETEYEFDKLREKLQNDRCSWINQFILGPENLRRIRVINEKLDALDSQLRVPGPKAALH